MVPQLRRRRPFQRIKRQTPLDKVYPIFRQLIRFGQGWMLGRDAYMEHDCPLIVQVAPRFAPGHQYSSLLTKNVFASERLTQLRPRARHIP